MTNQRTVPASQLPKAAVRRIRTQLAVHAAAASIAAGSSKAKAIAQATASYGVNPEAVTEGLRTYRPDDGRPPDAELTKDRATGRLQLVYRDGTVVNDSPNLSLAHILLGHGLGMFPGARMLHFLEHYYPTAERCLDLVEASRWPSGVTCIDCQSPDVGKLARPRSWRCHACHKEFSVTTGTILEDTRLSPRIWVAVTFLVQFYGNAAGAAVLAAMFGLRHEVAARLREEALKASRP